MKKIFALITLSLILSSTLAPGYLLAFEKTKLEIIPQNDFVVEPGKTEVLLDPGESIVKNIIVTNRINRTVRFRLSTEDFIGTDDPKQPVILLGDNYSPYSLKDLIVPEITEFSLEFGERIVIPVTITIPVNVEPRGYYGALIISNDPDKLEGNNTTEVEGRTRIISRIGSLFLLKINGQGLSNGNIENFKLIGPEKTFYSEKPDGFEIAFKNTGNVHLVPYGTITIKNMFGKVIQTLPVDAYFVLPDSTRYREIIWTKGFSIGRYSASLTLNKGYDGEIETVKLAFWVLPWKIMILGFISLVFIIAFIYYFFSRFELRKK